MTRGFNKLCVRVVVLLLLLWCCCCCCCSSISDMAQICCSDLCETCVPTRKLVLYMLEHVQSCASHID